MAHVLEERVLEFLSLLGSFGFLLKLFLGLNQFAYIAAEAEIVVYGTVFSDGDAVKLIVGIVLAEVLEYSAYSQLKSTQSFLVEIDK